MPFLGSSLLRISSEPPSSLIFTKNKIFRGDKLRLVILSSNSKPRKEITLLGYRSRRIIPSRQA